MQGTWVRPPGQEDPWRRARHHPGDRGAWRAAVHGATKSQTRPSSAAQCSVYHVCARAKLLQLCLITATLCIVAHQAPPAMGLYRQEHWSWLPFPSPGDLLAQGSNLGLRSPAWAGRFFATSTAWEALLIFQFSSVQSLSRVRLFATPWSAARQASLSITNSWSLLKLVSIESVMPSSHLILCCPLLLLPPIPPSIRVFSSESPLLILKTVLFIHL